MSHLAAAIATATVITLACTPASEPVAELSVEDATNPRVSHEATVTFEMASLSTEQTYRIDVALPYTYEGTESSYPVLYLLDSDVLFGLVTDVSRLLPIEAVFLSEERVPELIVVGIGYPGGVAEMSDRRGWDFNPPEEVNPDGAANFLRFISEQLIPRIESDYRTMTGDRTLLGSSRAGVFVMSTLFQQAPTFQRYVAISPILDPVIFEYERLLASSGGDLPVQLFLSAGDLGLPESDIAEGVGRLTEVLEDRSYPGLKLETRSYPGESHVSVLPKALVDGLVAVFSEQQ